MIFRLGSIRIKLSFSFVALIALMMLVCDSEIVLCSFLSSVIHESGHLFFMCIMEDEPAKIEFSFFGMRISKASNFSTSYKNEIVIALGGIIFNLIAGVLFYVVHKLSGKSELLIISVVNIVVAAVNSFPVCPLDSGRALRYLLKYKEIDESLFNVISCIFTGLFVFLSALYIVLFGINVSLIAVNLYLIFITVIKKWS